MKTCHSLRQLNKSLLSPGTQGSQAESDNFIRLLSTCKGFGCLQNDKNQALVWETEQSTSF